MTKKCSVCGRVMAEHECGDECAEIAPSIKVYEWRTGELVTVEVIEKPILVDDSGGEDMWFEVNIRFEDGSEHYADYSEKRLRWETGDN